MDPGLEDPIVDNARDVEHAKENDKDDIPDELDLELDYHVPSRWWFTSTAFPLIAGTFGPMASAFSICALVQEWRVYLPPDQDEAHGLPVKDPKWLIAVNAVSLVFALGANLALLLNMARRLSFSIAQPLTIIGWFLSSFMLIALVSVVPKDERLPAPPQHALTQAYYYGIFAAALYFLVASLMMLTVYGAWRGHYKKEFNLTSSQRTLMLQTISYLVYLLVSATIYAHIEGWKFLDAVYFVDFTLLTVGTGDFTPSTHLGRSLLFPFSIGGIVILGLVIGSIRSLILERGKTKIEARMVEKARERVLKSIKPDSGKVKLTPFRKRDLGSSDAEEKERRKREFLVMREVHEQATNYRQWASLAISATAWLVLWLVGAVVFFESETPQGWSYFEAIYFSYVSLLSIGYGDFYPQSNSGKAFFVFWSLLAVPTLTIVISNMGDTVIQGIKNLTLLLGSLTVLPDEGGFRKTIALTLQRLKKRLLGRRIESGEKVRVEGPSHSGPVPQDFDKSKSDESMSEFLEDETHYHWVIVKEIRTLMEHMKNEPTRKYSYEEWVWYLRLLGEDESSPHTHRPPIAGKEDGKMGTAGFDLLQGEKYEDPEKLKWSWLGNRSPLMGHQEEPEWIVERLSCMLERRLDRVRRRKSA